MTIATRLVTLALSAMGCAVAMAASEPGSGDTPEALGHVRRATALAGADLQAPLFLCRPDSIAVVKQNLESGSHEWLDAARLADDLYYVGNRFVGVLILRTS